MGMSGQGRHCCSVEKKLCYQSLHVGIERMDLLDSLVLVGHQLRQAGVLDQPLRVEVRVERRGVDVVRIAAAENQLG